MTRPIPFPLYIWAVLVSWTACGGRASSADSDSELPDFDVPSTDAPSTDAPSTDAPSVDMPAALQTLDLRRFDESIELESVPQRCKYAERLVVYFSERELSANRCQNVTGGFDRSRDITKFQDTDLERIQTAYAALRVQRGTQCASSADWLSLAVVSLDDSEDLQLLDAEHSACPLAGVEGQAFVEGLGQLYRLLAELRAQ